MDKKILKIVEQYIDEGEDLTSAGDIHDIVGKLSEEDLEEISKIKSDFLEKPTSLDDNYSYNHYDYIATNLEDYLRNIFLGKPISY